MGSYMEERVAIVTGGTVSAMHRTHTSETNY